MTWKYISSNTTFPHCHFYGKNVGDFLTMVTCSKAYAILISLASYHLNPPKQRPNGTPYLPYPTGTVMVGMPSMASTEDAALLGVMMASSSCSLINFFNTLTDNLFNWLIATRSEAPMPVVFSATRNTVWPISLIFSYHACNSQNLNCTCFPKAKKM